MCRFINCHSLGKLDRAAQEAPELLDDCWDLVVDTYMEKELEGQWLTVTTCNYFSTMVHHESILEPVALQIWSKSHARCQKIFCIRI